MATKTKKIVAKTTVKKTVKKVASAKASSSAKASKDKSAPKITVKITTGPLPDDKGQIIERFAQGKGDTGSPEVQVALLTHKIVRLTGHLDENKKDNHSRRGLLKVIAKRRRILNYLQKLDSARYKGLIESLNLKK